MNFSLSKSYNSNDTKANKMRRAFKITSTEKLVELKIKHVLRPYMSLIELLDLETELDERPLEEVAQAYFKLGYR